MSLDKTSVVDLVVKRETGSAELIVFDDGSVVDPVQRLRSLQSKLRTYATFVSTGQYRAQLPGIEPSQLSVSVVCVTPPTAAMLRLDRIRVSLVPPLTLPIRVETERASRERLAAARPDAGPATPPTTETTSPDPGSAPRSAIVLAGFTLAHAAVCVSDVAETLLPFALVENGGQRRIERFDAPRIEESVEIGKAAMANVDADAWALAYEGLVPAAARPDLGRTEKIDVFIVLFGARVMREPMRVVQPFEPFARRGRRSILGRAHLVIGSELGTMIEPEGRFLSALREGIDAHPERGVTSRWRW